MKGGGVVCSPLGTIPKSAVTLNKEEGMKFGKKLIMSASERIKSDL